MGAIELGSKADGDEKSSEMVKINQISSPKGAKERKIIVKPWPIKHVRATVYRTSSLAINIPKCPESLGTLTPP